MGKYSIKELERLSGIKAHTIRIWEKRYNIINPSRTNTNIRYYSDEDLKKILNISILKKNGFKIGNIAELSNQEILAHIEELYSLKSQPELYQDQLMIIMIDFDERKFEKTLSTIILKHGFEKAITDIVFPFMEKVGILWLTDNVNPSHEHFLSNIIRQKIIVAIDALPLVDDKEAPKVILFLPEHEMHELALLFYHYCLRKNGCRTIYLGQRVPIKEVRLIAEQFKPDHVITALSTLPENETTEEFFTQLSSNIPKTNVYVTGYQLRNYKKKLPQNMCVFRSYDDLQKITPTFQPTY